MLNMQTSVCWKSETTFNICQNNHRKDTKSEKSILACKHFNLITIFNNILNLFNQTNLKTNNS